MNNKLLLYLPILLSISLSLNAQCDDFYIICNQSEIDSFQSQHGPCTSLSNVVLLVNDTCDITNFEGFRSIEKISRLSFLIEGTPKYNALSGFESLRHIGKLIYNSKGNVSHGFPALDTILELDHTYDSSAHDLSLYSNIKHVNKLRLTGNGSFNGMQNLITNDNFNLLIIRNNNNNKLSKIINGSSSSIKSLTVIDCSNINFDNLENIDSINKLGISQCIDINLSSLLKLNNLESISISSNDTSVHFGAGFENITQISALWFLKNAYIKSIEEIFPNLQSIKRTLVLQSNDQINSIDFIANFQPPRLKIQHTPSTTLFREYIRIKNNPNLDMCTNKFLCDAIKEHPDSVFISNNGTFCNKDHLIDNGCLTLTTSNNEHSYLQVNPNPVYDYIRLDHISGEYTISSIAGKIILSDHVYDDRISTHNLSPGAYVLKIISENKSHTGVFIKQ